MGGKGVRRGWGAGGEEGMGGRECGAGVRGPGGGAYSHFLLTDAVLLFCA